MLNWNRQARALRTRIALDATALSMRGTAVLKASPFLRSAINFCAGRRLNFLTLFIIGFFAGPWMGLATAGPSSTTPPQSATEVTPANEHLRLNQLQYIGAHNSYHIAPPGELVVLAKLTNYATGKKWPAAKLFQALDYTHPDLTTQLELGLRLFELDVHADPAGGKFAKPGALHALAASDVPSSISFDPHNHLDTPGFKVFHGGTDMMSSCLTLKLCLAELKHWSQANPNHFPLIIQIESKTKTKPALAQAYTPPEETAFDPQTWRQLENEIIDAIGKDQLVTPQMVQGDATSLSAALKKNGWPQLQSLAGKFIFLLLTKKDETQSYRAARDQLDARLFFMSLTPADHHAGWFRIPDPHDRKLGALIRSGKLATVQADYHTIHSRLFQTDLREKAFDSGAQFILTDYPIPDRRFSNYQVRFGPRRYVRCNPVTFTDPCPF